MTNFLFCFRLLSRSRHIFALCNPSPLFHIFTMFYSLTVHSFPYRKIGRKILALFVLGFPMEISLSTRRHLTSYLSIRCSLFVWCGNGLLLAIHIYRLFSNELWIYHNLQYNTNLLSGLVCLFCWWKFRYHTMLANSFACVKNIFKSKHIHRVYTTSTRGWQETSTQPSFHCTQRTTW